MPGVLYHHERFDGTGYPRKLAGAAIPLVGRVIAVADAFDAMTSDRPYRSGMAQQAAIVELRQGAGKQLDPELVEVFVKAWEEGKLAFLSERQ